MLECSMLRFLRPSSLVGFLTSIAVSSAVTAQESPTYHEIREAQSLLYQADFNPGPIDGVWGGRTEVALIAFLERQGVQYDGDLSGNEFELLRNTPVGLNYQNRRFTSNGRSISQTTSSMGVTTFPGWELPQFLNPPPNDQTLAVYFSKWLRESRSPRYRVMGSSNPRNLSISNIPSDFLENQLRYGSALSYLFYDGSQIIYDATAPEDRFTPSFEVNNQTMFRSNSVGKSLVSYILGHAICEGYIQSIEGDLSDWPLMENTLYEGGSLIDLLNMRARDQHVVSEDDGFISSGRWFNNFPVANFANRELQGTVQSNRQIYNYHGFATNLLLNYVIFKTDEEWEAFLQRIIRDHIGFAEEFRFQGQSAPNDQGPGWYSFFATRYDYMRFALAVLEDWQNETCVGQYLRDVYKNRVSMGHNFNDPQRMTDVAQGYGGQFLFDFDGIRSRTLFGMNGYGGQNILIDMGSGRIAVVNSAHTNLDWQTLVYEAVRTGSLPQ